MIGAQFVLHFHIFFMKVIFLFIAIFIVSAKSFSQQSSTEIHYKYIDSLTQHAEANNNFF